MSRPVLNDHPTQQTDAVTPTASATHLPPESNSGRTHTITVQRLPHCVWTLARQNAKQSCLPFRYYLIRLFAASTPIPPLQTAPPAPDNQPTHTISVSRVPYQVWAHVRHNAMLSQRTFSNYLIEVIEQSSPLPISLGTNEKPQQP